MFSKLIYLKTFCFKDAVKVSQYIIKNEDDYNQKILEKNIFSNYNSTFCLLQQISTDNPEQYFILGIKFDDVYIPTLENDNAYKIKFFVYEKTFLFISNEALCKLFLNIFQFILNYKKLNFYQNLADFDSLFNNQIISNFNGTNKENVRNIF